MPLRFPWPVSGSTPRRSAALAGMLTFALLLPLWFLAGRWYQSRLLSDQRARVAEQVSPYGSGLTSALNERFARLQGLWAFIQATLPAGPSNTIFETYAANLSRGVSGFRSYGLLPDGVIQDIYPPSGSSTDLGRNVLADSRLDVSIAAGRAIQTRQITLQGPSESSRGDLSLTAWRTIYVRDQFWGLVSMDLDLLPILADAGVGRAPANLNLAIRDSGGQTFHGDRSVFDDKPVTVQIALPDGDWELAGAPHQGWSAAVREPLLIVEGADLAIVALLSGLAFLTINRQNRLAFAVRERTQELSEANELLGQRVDERTRELASLLDVSRSVALAESLETILNKLAQSVVEATGAVACTVVLVEGDPPKERIAGTHGLPDGFVSASAAATRLGARPLSILALDHQRPVVLRDARQALLSRPEWRPVHPMLHQALWDTIVSVPLVSRERPFGMLSIFYQEGHEPDKAELAFSSAIADQAAVAVENARLFSEAQGKAALEERQRLARELHDSVSQALYGIGLGARTARTLLDRDPAQAAQPLDYVLSLAEAGLAEMRALIFELRPDSLETEGLVAALERQATLLRARHNVAVEMNLCDEPEMPLECKETLYRIAQEAMYNTVKHARATQVEVCLECRDGEAMLTIGDNGIGFDPSGAFPGHLGLRSMRERAARMGGTLDIQSTPGHGACIRARIPC
ncbi:MAG: histidine kinase [Dehalococcoidia bacterium]